MAAATHLSHSNQPSTRRLGRGYRKVGDLYLDLSDALRLHDEYTTHGDAHATGPPLDASGRVDEEELEERREHVISCC